MDDEYNLVSYKLFGKAFYQRNRKITKRFSSKVNLDISNELPICILLISDYPFTRKEIFGGYEGYDGVEDSRWQQLAIDIISYSIIEAFFTGKIGVVEFHENTKVALNLYDETNVNLAIVPGVKSMDRAFWLERKINELSLYKLVNKNSGSHINEQLSFLINNLVGFRPYPFAEFSKAIVAEMKEDSLMVGINTIDHRNFLFRWDGLRLEISDENRGNMQRKLSSRKNQLNALIKEDRFISRFFKITIDHVCKVLENKVVRRDGYVD